MKFSLMRLMIIAVLSGILASLTRVFYVATAGVGASTLDDVALGFMGALAFIVGVPAVAYFVVVLSGVVEDVMRSWMKK